MKNLKGKKLLVLGGAFQHCKVVEVAKKLGVIVYVTDYLSPEEAPAKQIADKYYMHNITDIDEIVKMCKEENIDGILATHLDACQLPYQKICERLGLPCFGNEEQFRYLTDKKSFKKICIENGVDVIPSYTVSDFESKEICDKNVEFPILIKPAMSRGSRGQTICNCYDEVKEAINFALSESGTCEVVIEKYMGNKNDFSMSYVMINGEACLTRTGNRYLGSREDKMDKLAIAGVSPSAFTDLYINKVDQRVVNMLKNIGLKTAPVFMQGFVDGDTVRFYDPGLRFPGIEYESMYQAAVGINPILPLIEFALTGSVSEEFLAMKNTAMLNGKIAVDLLVAIKPGTIKAIRGLEKIRENPSVVSVFTKYKEGDTVGEHYNVNQRFCEIDVVCPDMKEMKDTIEWIYDTLYIENEDGENMVFAKLDTNNLISEV